MRDLRKEGSGIGRSGEAHKRLRKNLDLAQCKGRVRLTGCLPPRIDLPVAA